jgi:hypothetical protein
VGDVASPPMKTRRWSRRGAVMLPARRWTGAICRGHPRRRLPAPLKCHNRGGRRRPRATRKWARARDKQLALPKRTSDRFALTWRPAGRAPPSRRESCPAKLTPPRRSEERPAPVRQLIDGSDRPNSDSQQRRRSQAKSTNSASTPSMLQVVDSGAAPRRLQSLLTWGGGAPNVHDSLVAGEGQGPTPTIVEAGGSAPEQTGECVVAVEAADRSGADPELAGSKQAAPEQGSSGRPAKKSRVRSKM